MRRDHYALFSAGRIGPLILPNRIVRSATWDPAILKERRMTEEVLSLYGRVASGGAGLIITGDFSVVPGGMLDDGRARGRRFSYEDVRIEGFGRLVTAVRRAAPSSKILAQISGEYPGVAPSSVRSPFASASPRALSTGQVERIVECFVETVAGLKAEGFDGIQLHAAHGGLLSKFLSPYTNRRSDKYGGCARSRARIIDEIVSGSRKRVGDFPILIKLNGTDYLEGGIDIGNFPELAGEIERTGVDAVEISGGMRECLVRTEEDLGFPPVPAPESHTRLKSSRKQSYFLRHAEALDLRIPVILVGGNRDVESLEQIVRRGKVDFVALCRPLICEPDLPSRWLEGRGGPGTDCISCNSCIYHMSTQTAKGEPQVVTCLLKHDRRQVKAAQQWLSSWVSRNLADRRAV